jgi:hypothetical protein
VKNDFSFSIIGNCNFIYGNLFKNPATYFRLLNFFEKHRYAPDWIGLAKYRPSTRSELTTSKTRPKKLFFFITTRGLIGATLIGAESKLPL